MAKPVHFEAALISLAGTVKYLGDSQDLLKRKPLIPKKMESSMQRTGVVVKALCDRYSEAIEEAQLDAVPFIVQLLASMGLKVGGGFSVKVNSRDGIIEAFGYLSRAEVSRDYLGTMRAIVVYLEDLQLRASGTSAGSWDKLTKADTKFVPYGLIEAWPYDEGGVPRNGLKVRIPVKAADRSYMARVSTFSQVTYSSAAAGL